MIFNERVGIVPHITGQHRTDLGFHILVFIVCKEDFVEVSGIPGFYVGAEYIYAFLHVFHILIFPVYAFAFQVFDHQVGCLLRRYGSQGYA
ncbi:hypothetical protein D3C87_1675230 [compost metagenome]